MITLDIHADPKCAAQFKQLSAQFPNEMRRANGRAASIVRGKLRSVMKSGGGTNGVPGFVSLHALTVTLRNGRTDAGGKLADSRSIVMFRRGNAQVVGWPGSLAGFASAFQESQTREMVKDEICHLYRNSGWTHDRIDRTFARPARPVVDPLMRGVSKDYPRWVMGAATKLINKTLTKRGF